MLIARCCIELWLSVLKELFGHVLDKKEAFEIFVKSLGKYLCRSLFNENQGLQLAVLSRKAMPVVLS